MYLLSGCEPDGVEHLRQRLDELGDSVAIAASASDGGGRYSVHVHSDDAGGAIEAALPFGTPSRIQITALTGGSGTHAPGGWTRERAVLAVVDGDGAAELFAGEGAHVLRPDPDATDPTTAVTAKQLLRGLVDAGAAQIMVLPNGFVAAEELVAGCTAAIGWGIDVVPVPAGSMVQGLAALGRARRRPAGSRRRLHDGPRRRGCPARLGPGRHRGGVDMGGRVRARRRPRHRR